MQTRSFRRLASSLAVAATVVVSASGCSPASAPDEDTARVASLPFPLMPTPPFDYAPDLPESHLGPLVTGYDNTPVDNATTDAGAALGRVLFYDRRLSANGTIACASCHRQDHGFGDPEPASRGFEGGRTTRHAMPIIDARFYAPGRFFWDERAETLEQQVLMPIENEVEMGMSLEAVVERLEATTYYAPLFEAAFGDAEISADRVSRALAQFVRSLVSYRSRWDLAVAQVDSIAGDLPGFTEEENRGKELFFGQHDPTTRGLCGACHLRDNELAPRDPDLPPLPETNVAAFFMDRPRSNGLPDPDDQGVAEISGVATDAGLFKSPSLRNVALRPPYMHDGRFPTLEAVVDFYDHAIAPTPTLDPILRNPNGSPIRLDLTPADRAALVAFLRTLTDASLATDPRFSDPFPGE